MAQENILGTQKIGKLLLKFGLPGIISFVVNSIYNIVDQIFIGQSVGFLGNASTSVIFPITTAVVALGLLLGDGAAANMSLNLGMGKKHEASQAAAFGLISTLIAGAALCAVCLIFIEPLCWLFGGTPDNIQYCLDYGTIISNLRDTAWKEVCKLKGIDYSEPEQPTLNIIPCSSDTGLIVTAKSLNIRDYPKTGKVVGYYSGGAKVYPTGKVYVSDTDVWIQTNKGFISRKYLKGWITEQEGKWYVESGDNYPHGTLREIGGSVYYFNDAGWLETNRELKVKAAEDGSLSVQ